MKISPEEHRSISNVSEEKFSQLESKFIDVNFWGKERRKKFSKRTDSQTPVGVMKPSNSHKIETVAVCEGSEK